MTNSHALYIADLLVIGVGASNRSGLAVSVTIITIEGTTSRA
jgi:hypothetical protein